MIVNNINPKIMALEMNQVVVFDYLEIQKRGSECGTSKSNFGDSRYNLRKFQILVESMKLFNSNYWLYS